MGDASKLKVAIWQRELREGSMRESLRDLREAVERAEAAGADCLVVDAFEEEGTQGVIPCGSSTAAYGADGMVLHTADDDYGIAFGKASSACDLAVRFDPSPWAIDAPPKLVDCSGTPTIAVCSAGMRNAGHAVRCFDGGSAVFGPDGRAIAALRDDFESDFALVKPTAASTSARATIPGADAPTGKLLCALTKTIARFDAQVLGGRSPWIIGLSGGLDSSVVAALLVRALGANRVLGFSLPTAFNSQATRQNAAELAQRLGIRYAVAPIGDVVDATASVVAQAGYSAGALCGLPLENAQARVRGHMLSTFAAIEGGVVANNGNFVECALGYSTLYGDSVGALAPIADLTKVELFDLARALNSAFGEEIVPGNLLPRETENGYEWETMPSAELADGQRDPMKWFYHDWLVRKLKADPNAGAVEVMRAYSCDRLESCGMRKWIDFYGLDDAHAFVQDLEWVLASMHRATFKRIQAAPAILVTRSAAPWGDGEVQRRWEPDRRYTAMKDRLLALR